MITHPCPRGDRCTQRMTNGLQTDLLLAGQPALQVLSLPHELMQLQGPLQLPVPVGIAHGSPEVSCPHPGGQLTQPKWVA